MKQANFEMIKLARSANHVDVKDYVGILATFAPPQVRKSILPGEVPARIPPLWISCQAR